MSNIDKIFKYEKFNEKLLSELTSTSKDIVIDYAEIGIDSIFADEIIKEIPILKTIAAVCNVGIAISERYFAKKVAVFIKQFHETVYKAYYYSLKQSSIGWHTNENSYFPFIENFLSTLYICYKELDKRFAVVHGKRITKKTRVEATVLNSLIPISKAEICKILPDVSPTTVEAVLGSLVKDGQLRKLGSSRSTRYIKA